MSSIKSIGQTVIPALLLLAASVLGVATPVQAKDGEDHISGKNFEVSGLRHLKVSRCCTARDFNYQLFFAFDPSVKNWVAYPTEQDLIDDTNRVLTGTYRPTGRAGRHYEMIVDQSGENLFLEAVIKPWALENLKNPDEVDPGDSVNITIRKVKMKLDAKLERFDDDVRSVKVKASFKLRRTPKDLEDAGRKGSGIFRLKLEGTEISPPV